MSPQAQQAVLPDYLRKRGLIRATIFSPANTWKMILLAVCFLALHQFYLRKLFRVWVTEPDWSHGFIIPLFSLYFIASNYQKLLKVRVKTSRFGLLLVLGGLAMETLALVFTFDYALYLGMIVMLFGIVLWLAGWQVMKIVWLPVLFLFFAVNVPEMIYREVAYAFQQFAAHASVFILQITGVEADMAGALGQAETVIDMYTAGGHKQQLNVEEACSGMRLLMAFGALSVAVSYLSDRAPWQRVILVLSALPIALFCNLLRVLITGYLYYFGYPTYAQGIFHTFTGLLMLIPAGVMFLGLAKLLDQLLVEDYSDQQESKAPPAPANNSTPPDAQPADDAPPDQSSAPPAPKSIWRQLIADRTFLTCLIIVLLAATGLQGAVGILNMSLLKKPAPLRRDLASLPIKLGSFDAHAFKDPETETEEIDVTLSEEVVHALGTELYLQRNYVDSEPTDDLAPAVTLFTTYYTGKPVLVPHVPERCQAAAGYTKGESETFTVEIPGIGLPNDTLTVRATSFSGTDDTGKFKSFAIIYFFVANGGYFDDWVKVRVHFRTPKAYFLDKHSYYAFLRLTFPQSKSKEQCIAAAKKYLKVAVPEMINIWPDWKKLEQAE